MNKAVSLFLILLSLALLFVSCSSENSVDEAFNCTITFNGNGSTAGEMSVQKVGIGKETRINANAYERTQHLFKGWNTEADGSGTAYSDGQIISLSGNITLYAQWEIIPIILDSSMDEWTNGNVYILNSDVTIGDRIDVFGSVTLVLNDGFTLTASRGINVEESNSLTIEATGEGSGILEATANGGDAGIGGDINHNSGTIIINGGTVNTSTKGGSAGAGIGGGRRGNGGTITINGGTVNASAASGGSGIGGGWQGNGGNLTINGGTVTASSTSSAAGIGRGAEGDSDGTLTLGEGVAFEVSHNNITWSDYDGTTRQKYMRTK